MELKLSAQFQVDGVKQVSFVIVDYICVFVICVYAYI
jgi:hypothetical protein